MELPRLFIPLMTLHKFYQNVITPHIADKMAFTCVVFLNLDVFLPNKELSDIRKFQS